MLKYIYISRHVAVFTKDPVPELKSYCNKFYEFSVKEIKNRYVITIKDDPVPCICKIEKDEKGNPLNNYIQILMLHLINRNSQLILCQPIIFPTKNSRSIVVAKQNGTYDDYENSIKSLISHIVGMENER